MATCASCRKSWGEGVDSCPDDGTALLPDELVAGADATLPPGTMVGDYRIERKIGEGAYGTVYAAEHPVIGKRAAIKVLNRKYSSDIGIVSRFVTEARAVNRIRHPNIVDIFAFGQVTLPGQGEQHFLAMELLDGIPLEQLLRDKGPLKLAEALPILRAVAEALDAAHQHGIVHRDLKPDNIFLVREKGGTFRPKLLDFGVAKLHADGESSHKTATGIAIGTPYYMSPEQCRGKKVEASSDIYALGAVTYQVLTGRPPFEGESVMDVLMKHMNDTPPPMSELDPRLGGMVDGAVATMLAKKPKARPMSATAAIELLAEASAAAAAISGAATISAAVALPRRGAPTVATPTPVSTPSVEVRATGGASGAVPVRSGLAVAASTPVIDHAATGDTIPAPPSPGSTLRSADEDSGERAGPESPHVAIASGPKGTTLGAISAPSTDRSAALGLRVGLGLGAVAALAIAFILLKSPPSDPAPGSPAATSAPASAVAPVRAPEPAAAPSEPVTVVGPAGPAASDASPPSSASAAAPGSARPRLGGPLRPPASAKPSAKPADSAPKPPAKPPGGGGILEARD